MGSWEGGDCGDGEIGEVEEVRETWREMSEEQRERWQRKMERLREGEGKRRQTVKHKYRYKTTGGQFRDIQ